MKCIYELREGKYFLEMMLNVRVDEVKMKNITEKETE